MKKYSKYVWLLGLGCLIVGGVTLCFLLPATEKREKEEGGIPKEITKEMQPAVLPASVPVTLEIPRLKISTTFEGPLGLNPDGSIEVPESYEEIGWYSHGPTPGERGPAVVVGHVDSYKGPAVFFSLGQLKEGDDIFISREDGTTAHFQVTELGRYGQGQAEFPTAKVYSDLPFAGLRLITCSGYFDRGAQRYSHNLVVFASLIN